MNSLVLSGGEMKGAYQAGVIAGLARRGCRFGLLCGTSVGALNATYLADRMGKGRTFNEAAEDLLTLWMDRVTGPDRLIRKRSAWQLAMDVLRNRWTGWLDLSPLQDLMWSQGMRDADISRSPIPAMVSVVRMDTAEVSYQPASQAWALASGTQPILMQPVPVGGTLYYDGGLRDVAPLRYPINSGSHAICAILCQPEDLPFAPKDLSLPSMAGRVLSILLNEIVTNDLDTAARVNAAVLAGTDAEHRYVPLTVIRPATALHGGISSFTKDDIDRMIGYGLTDAMTQSNDAIAPFLR